MWVAFAFFFSKNISVYAIFNDKSFNVTLTNNIVSFELLGPEVQKDFHSNHPSIPFLLREIFLPFYPVMKCS